jgi:predicted RNA-binding protein with PUA-like domain
MNIWLLKTEPHECSLDDIRAAAGGVMRWDGIRNYQARNWLRDAVRAGDLCLIYHSGVREPALVGSAEVVRAAYPDPAQFDPASPWHDPAARPDAPRWVCIDVRYREHFARPVTLAAIKASAGLAQMVLLRQGRLSVQPVSADEWRAIATLAGASAA